MNDEDGRIIRNATYLFAGSAVADMAGFLFRLVVARGFGPEGFGLFSLALMTVTIATAISLIGLPDGIITFVSRLRSDGEANLIAGVLVSSFAIAGAASIAITAVLLLITPAISVELFETAELIPLLRTFVLGIPARVTIALTAAVCLGYERGGLQTIIKRILPKLGTFGAAAAIVVVKGSLQDVIMAYVVVLWCTAGAGLVLASVSVRGTPVDGVKLQTRDLLSFSIPLLFTGVLAFFLNWTDAALIGYFLESSDVGIYQAAFVLGTNIAVFQGAIAGAMYPNFGSLVATDDVKTLQNQFVTGVRWIVIFTLAPSVYLVTFSEMSIQMLFGEEFVSGRVPLLILVTGQFLWSVLALSTDVLKATKNSRYILLTYTVALVANVFINVILIPVIGIIGAAIGTITAQIFAKALHYRWVRQQFEVYLPVKSIGRIVSGALLAVVLTMPLLPYVTSASIFFIHIMLFSLLYTVSMLALGVVSIGEVQRFVAKNVPRLE